MITFDEKFFEAEVRDDFRISPMMKRCWAAEMEVLCQIDRICKKHGIPYFADWGTLLGAVRHKGFIPWDDDMDIAMKRPDYERFWPIAIDELPRSYVVTNIHTNREHVFVGTKISNAPTMQFGEEHLREYHGCPYVVNVDIFPVDYVPRQKEDEEMWTQMVNIVSCAAIFKEDPDTDEETFQQTVQMIRELCGAALDGPEPIEQQLGLLGEQLCGLYGEADADYLTALHRLVGGQPYYVPKECYDEVIMMPFENIEIPVPVGYDLILKLKYGDYMTVRKGGGSHEYPFYREQEELLAQMLEENHLPLSTFYIGE